MKHLLADLRDFRHFICRQKIKNTLRLYRFKNGRPWVDGMLQDYPKNYENKNQTSESEGEGELEESRG